MGRKLALSLILALLLWGIALPAFAEGGKVLFGESFTLRKGETYVGDVVIFGGNLNLEEGGLLEGDAAVFGGIAKIAGTLKGDLAVFGGGVWVESTGRIEGDVAVMGGKLEKEEGAVITGEVTEMGGLSWPKGPFLFPVPLHPRYRPFEDLFGWLLGRGVRFFLTLLALMAASVLIISLWPEQVQAVAETVTKAPLESGGIGLAAIVLGVPVGLVLLIAACLGLLVWLALLIAGLFGLTALAYEVGKRVLERSGASETSPIFQVLLGVAFIQVLDLIPCLGSLLLLVVYSLGIGAVILSRFGTYRGYWAKEGAGGASGIS
jgi:hypothetical protein